MAHPGGYGVASQTLSPQQLIEDARRAREAGDLGRSIELLQQCVEREPDQAVALNMLGLSWLAAGRPEAAVGPLRRAVAVDPEATPLRLNLADALLGTNALNEALEMLDAALQRDPYLLTALIRKARMLELLGRREDALYTYRALLKALPHSGGLPPSYDEALAYARRLVEADGSTRLDRLAPALEVAKRANSPRARAYLEQLCGLRPVYLPQPTGPYFPFLPPVEYFDNAQIPWLATLDAATPVIREELLALWREDAPGFDPYVQFGAADPVNQWRELNHSPRWSAFFLWRDGERQAENIRRCPKTAAVIERLPLADVPGKAPTVMFSILAPHTHIPPHTGVTNTRAVVHLPLVVPDGCRFRVGGETRSWVEGQAWAFDDTIEHEAWNDSDKLRAILIVDAWNPYLSEDEQAVVRLAANEVRL